ncbi:hypothetical protein RQM47_07425 [Rubrivirga sp. S365]|uniref:Uncharacterized protein n=1 Tax=Rubrivirga litoralis TaxID=3075598 RepID=A0ABU3BRD0_9BACT|nr:MULTISPECIES: hypothetical protein [unclassified Rubrivirga]MDT0631842.1 hypothetical protein [Rubrivirga sp. F394]MDT7856466.1 hypothetical protein [Rubrivirga sp. S365]
MSAPRPPAPPTEPIAWKQVASLALIVAGVWAPLALALLLA